MIQRVIHSVGGHPARASYRSSVLRHNVPDENDRHHNASASGYHSRLTPPFRQRHQLARFLVKEGVHQLHVITFDAAIKRQPQTYGARGERFCVKLPERDQ